MNDRELAGAVIRGFLEDCPLQLAVLSKRVSEADATGARHQAHRIKGAAAAVAAEALRARASEMERAAAAGDLECAGALLPRANEEFERLRTAWQAAGWLGHHPAPELEP